MPDRVAIVGRFPPPFDGQSIGTETLAALLEPLCSVVRFDLSTGESRFSQIEVRFRPARVAHYLTAGRRLRRALSDLSGAPVIWTSMSPAWLGHIRDLATIAPGLRGAGPRIAVLHRGTFHTLFERRLTRPTMQRLVRNLTAFVFLDQRLSEKCGPWIPASRRFVIPNTIDDTMLCTEAELDAKRSIRAPGAPIRLLFLSSMSPLKGYLDVAKSIAVLKGRGIDARARFVGRWETPAQEREFRSAVESWGAADRIEHLGAFSDRQRVRSLFLESDVFVLPTYHPTEAQPISILEALNAGTPVIATRQGGIPQMIEDGVEGRFVAARSPEAIADAVERWVPIRAWAAASLAARTRFVQQFHPDAVRKQWIDLLARLQTRP